nr:uncharacterized protein LOC111418058 [Onthophagus taurus]
MGALIRNANDHSVLVMGDFNAKSPEWGAQATDNRGDILSVWAISLGLRVLNTGEATWCRGDKRSHIDVTLCNDKCMEKDVSWEISDHENLSDHKDIIIIIRAQNKVTDNSRTVLRWKMKNVPEELLKKVIKKETKGWLDKEIGTPEELEKITIDICNKAFGGRKNVRKKEGEIYWWTDTVEQLKRKCCKLRRVVTRANKWNTHGEEVKEQREEYKRMKKQLTKQIRDEKKKPGIT